MGKGEKRHPVMKGFAALLVVLLVAGGVAQWRYDVVDRVDLPFALPFGIGAADPRTEPAQVRPPGGLELARQPIAPAVAPVALGAPADPARVRAAVSKVLASEDLGPHVAAVVTDLRGRVLFRSGSGIFRPASTLKLLTSVAGLESLGPQTRFHTDVVRVGNQLTLVGGGDPFLASTPAAAAGRYPSGRAALSTLAARTAASLRAAGVTRVRLSYDDSLFTGPGLNPAWPSTYFPEGVVPPISALWVDEAADPDGSGYLANPAAGAASAFATALKSRGVTVVGQPVRRTTPAAAARVARVLSPTVGQIVQRLVDVSDNNAAEVIARHVAIAEGQPATFTGGAAAVRDVLSGLGVDTTGLSTFDGSGLSRRDRLRPQTLADVLVLAASADHPQLRDVINGLSVSGFDGSLKARFAEAPAWSRGRVQAKTGTLSAAGTHSLAGIAVDRDGTPLVFAALTDRVKIEDTLAARADLDRFAALLSACSCASSGSETLGSTP